ncbi:NAD(P)H-dependent oxidoreductase [Galbibacter pacificus]|uniref:NAD(P)H-dependent oxidoreductase n=1 Tax=Galbibacter pacificus TaxID=2996052 RepID=A0ABT6FST4_9FLAO|nr:NAD(P)H-dependent oxidoreductase [Galbibacter pacificus]MDG3582547.1 NAD(P)H-dependent oxidoreductase [Galbibacter pacificus]MDG3586334.1 NAD(P)H-dependent oxidoreductase [Galbibacter pacificus]
MKHLIIYAHPNTRSLNGHIKQVIVEHLAKNGHEVKVRDLYQQNFNPILSLEDLEGQRIGQVEKDVKIEQNCIVWADCIIFIHPIWWTGLPAVLKGYIDRVFSYGFAYRYDHGIQKGLLEGKQAVVINTQGKSHAEYGDLGMDKALKLTSDRGIYTYCGLDVKHHLFFDQADRATSETIEKWGRKIKSIF